MTIGTHEISKKMCELGFDPEDTGDIIWVRAYEDRPPNYWRGWSIGIQPDVFAMDDIYMVGGLLTDAPIVQWTIQIYSSEEDDCNIIAEGEGGESLMEWLKNLELAYGTPQPHANRE